MPVSMKLAQEAFSSSFAKKLRRTGRKRQALAALSDATGVRFSAGWKSESFFHSRWLYHKVISCSKKTGCIFY